MDTEQLPDLYILTADVGGSHITAGICNLKTGLIVPGSLTRAEVNSAGAAEIILSVWASTLQQVLNNNSLQVSGLVLAMPGPFDYDKGISYIKGLNKYESIYGVDIRKYLARVLEMDEQLVMFRNDAESTIAGEVLAGSGKDYDRVLGITLGTGFGSAFSSGKLTSDLNLGSDAYKSSIADDYFSTRWFEGRYAELTGKTLIEGVKELAELAEKNEQYRLIFDEFAEGLAAFLSEPVKKRQPEVLVICGNIARASKFFLPQLKEKLNGIAVELAQLGESAPLIGAAVVFKQKANPARS